MFIVYIDICLNAATLKTLKTTYQIVERAAEVIHPLVIVLDPKIVCTKI